jgi:hypothetical protein
LAQVPGQGGGGPGPNPNAPVIDFDSDPADTVLLMNCSAANSINAKFIFWRGVPDVFVVAGGIPINNQMDNFVNWVALQTLLGSAGWGWLGRPAIATGTANITAITQDATGVVNFTTDQSPFPVAPAPGAPPPGSVVAVRISGVLQPKSINGVIPVVVGALPGTIFKSKKNIGILPYTSGGKVTYEQNVLYQFNTYLPNPQGGLPLTTGIYLQRIGERKAGRPLGAPRGRLPNRARN